MAPTLTPDMILVLGLIGFTVVMLILEWVRSDVVALLVLVVLGITHVIPTNRLFDGFDSDAVLSLIGIMIMGEGLDRTGLLNKAASFILRLAGNAEGRASLLLNTTVGLLSSVIQSQALAALFLPVANRISKRTGIPLKRLLLPMGACILAGTNMLLISNSPLILLNSLVASANRSLPSGAHVVPLFSLFALVPIGIPLLLAGIGYFALLTRYLIPDEVDGKSKVTSSRTQSYFADTYGIAGGITELTVTADSPLVGMSIGEAQSLDNAPVILAAKNGNEARLEPSSDSMIWVGTALGVMGPRPKIDEFARSHACRVSPRVRAFSDMFDSTRAGISEVIVPPSSKFADRQVGELHLRKRYGLSVLALSHGDIVTRGEDIRGMTLHAGDTLVIHSYWHNLRPATEDRDLVPITEIPSRDMRPGKMRYALVFFALALALGLFSNLKLGVAMLTGAVGMLLTGVLSMDEGYAAVKWKTIFVMACLIPLGIAMDTTGTAVWLAHEILRYLGGLPQWGIQAFLAILALVLSQVISHVGTAVMMVPMAINIALASGGNPSAYAVIVVASVSNTFLIPGATPVLLIISGPSNFKLRDFVRVGLPLTVILLVVLLVMVNLIFP